MRHGADGRDRPFPSRDDLVEDLIHGGHVASEEDLLKNHPNLISTLFFAWIASGQTACQFATYLARYDPAEIGWLSTVVQQYDADIGDQLNAVLHTAFGRFEAAQFIFTSVSSPEEIARLIAWLCTHPDWWWADYGTDGSNILIGLRWTAPSRKYFAALLGFSDLPSMPFTRRSPYSALVLRPKEPEEHDGSKWEECGMRPIHLAYMPSGLETGRHERFWAATERLKKAYVGDECAAAARARVTFSLPDRVRSLLPDPAFIEQ